MKTVLAAIDLSRDSGRVGAAALDLARRTGSRLVLLHVTEPPPVELHGVGFAREQIAGMLAVIAQRLARRLEALGRRCARAGCLVRTEQVSGRSVPVILARARALKARWLVLGSHGHGAAYGLLVGSKAQGVLRHPPCPVLVVPVGRRR
jgi:nucleotide-binding universal stress UspA family protein